MKKLLKLLLPLLVLAGGIFGAKALIDAREPAASEIPERQPPLVEAFTVLSEPQRLMVTSDGEVRPRSEVDLVAEVSGMVVEVSPLLDAGLRFAAGETLLRIDPTDYRLALTRAEAEVATASAVLDLEEAEAQLALSEWQAVGEGEPGALVLREPQLAQARARLAAAVAGVEQARRNLERCTIRAPYAGLVLARYADLGRYLVPAAPVARVHAVDYAEVRLPLSAGDLRLLELPAAGGGNGDTAVELRGLAGGREHLWRGRLVRIESALDPATRMQFAVARIDAPFRADPISGRPALPVGTYLRAAIQGRAVDPAWRFPRAALRPGSEVLIIDNDDRLQRRAVEVVQAGRQEVIVSDGLADGERLCLTPLEVVVEGMQVRVAEPSADEGTER